jgi:hypothetical protein
MVLGKRAEAVEDGDGLLDPAGIAEGVDQIEAALGDAQQSKLGSESLLSHRPVAKGAWPIPLWYHRPAWNRLISRGGPSLGPF